MVKTIKIDLDFRESLEDYLAAYLKQNYPPGNNYDYQILSQSLDARNARNGRPPHVLYSLKIFEKGEDIQCPLGPLAPTHKHDYPPPIIIGAGPAGIFAALYLLEHGVKSILIERGECVQQRLLSMVAYWKRGELKPDSNVEYGAGGAGLFSDGKLFTRIKSPFLPYVLQRLVDFGAPPAIRYLREAQLGSNRMRKIISQLLDYLSINGVIIRYNTRVTKFLIDRPQKNSLNVNGQQVAPQVIGVESQSGERIYSPHIILASGHSAREIYHTLHAEKVAMRAKPFAVGVRIEHPRKYIDQLFYGNWASHPKLNEPAAYRLKSQQGQRAIYTFCMCPGGVVLPAATEIDGLVINGMSNQGRNGYWSNSAIVVSVDENDFGTAVGGPLDGIAFQQAIECRAYEAGINAQGKKSGGPPCLTLPRLAPLVPACTVESLLRQRKHSQHSLLPHSSTPGRIFTSDFSEILPAFICDAIRDALLEWDRQIPGFATKALLLAPETRTSSPVTIERDPTSCESISHRGLYPCGEGAGHAGGITSAATDGIKVASAILK
ncbi:MAG: FAD-dependent oxidoreductase [Oligoflexia bacterium]|nr:FAD-dependent oxidoreductase [Oligoflexia bacterium]